MKPVPIDQLERRLPTAGRIRIGRTVPARSGKPRPDKLASFRFTSQDKASIEQVAALYGGEKTPWRDHPGQWEVYTPAKMLRVVMPPAPITQAYELWEGGGCIRRCTGRTVQLRTQGPDGGDVVEQDCICWQKGTLECQRKTRLSVILPEVKFLGVWRLDTGSKIASEELPGMVDTFEHLRATRGLPFAELRLVEHVNQVWSVAKGKWMQSRMFVPTLGFDQSPEQLAVAGPPMAALEAGPPTPPKGELVSSGDSWADIGMDPQPKPGDVIEPIAVSAYHPDPSLVAAWKDSLTTTQQNKVLALTREAWQGVELPPTSFEQIPLEVIDLFMERGVDVMERHIRS